ncbi:MAG TPA: ECF-type sigma factor [Pyrinomonadaceae bacterium]|nr:ECF-type sigma factor [Pyrinomonadaceae bacterium]
MAHNDQITDLLKAWSRGDHEALAKLLPLVDHELKRIAHAFMLKERVGHSLHTSALVQEALARLIVGDPIDWQSRKHFYAIIARRMRHILIEHARARLAAKRGNRAEHVNVDEVIYLSIEMSEELVLLDEALTKLAGVDERKAMIVELLHFGGFTIDEVAALLELSPTTVQRDWRFARSWLKREIS